MSKNILNEFKQAISHLGYIDPSIYIDREKIIKEIKKSIDRSLILDSSISFIIYGPYGVGKTHTLLHLKHYLHKIKGIEKVCFVNSPLLHRRSTFVDLYKQIIVNMGQEYVYELFEKISTKILRENKIEKEYELFKPINNLINHRDFTSSIISSIYSSDTKYVIWKWLIGEKMSNREKNMLGIVNDNNNTLNAIKTLSAIIIINYLINKKPLAIMIDELENITLVNQEYGVDFIQGFRSLLEIRKGLILFFTFASEHLEDVPYISENKILLRIGRNEIHKLDYFSEFEAKEYIIELLERLRINEKRDKIRKNRFYPFTPEAIERILIENQLTPRKIMMMLARGLGNAVMSNSLIVTGDMVE